MSVSTSAWLGARDTLSPAAASLPALDPTVTAADYDRTLADLHATRFIATNEFLLDMGGHELMKALVRELRSLGAPAGVDELFVSAELLAGPRHRGARCRRSGTSRQR